MTPGGAWPATQSSSRPAVELRTDTIDSEIGSIVVVTRAQALCALDFSDCEERMKELLSRRFEDFVLRHEDNPLGVGEKMEAYLAGDLRALDRIAVDPGGTEFQQTVWTALRAIPAGSTRTYGQVAAAIGRPSASRAVGLANSLNPVAIVIPCHRVIGSDGALTGYAGGLDRKRWLLRHEGAVPSRADLFQPPAGHIDTVRVGLETARRRRRASLKPLGQPRLQEDGHGYQGW